MSDVHQQQDNDSPTDDTVITAEGDKSPEYRTIKVTIKFKPLNIVDTWDFPPDATLDELILACDDQWPEFDWNQCKLICESGPRRLGLKSILKASDDGDFDLSIVDDCALRILAQKRTDLENLHKASASAMSRQKGRQRRVVRQRNNKDTVQMVPRAWHRDSQRDREDRQYTFLTLRPLPNLPHPERSLEFLTRLRYDPGIRAVMRKYRFVVALLAEMDPMTNTQVSHEGTTRLLGLNRNQGEVIELRLRTDAYDGWRDYRTVRKTLCHELAHNRHGPHNRDFWDLCKEIEQEVAVGDRGRPLWEASNTLRTMRIGLSEGSNEEDEEGMDDHGGWTGGEFVLGSSGGPGSGANCASGAGMSPLSRREILARAAESRIRLQDGLRPPPPPPANQAEQEGSGESGDGT